MAVDSRGPPDRDRLYLGWQHALVHPDPGPAPKRPTPPPQYEVDPSWVEAQRHVENQLNRPLQLAGALALGVAGLFGLLGWPLAAVPRWTAAVAVGICLVVAGVTAYAIRQGERALRVRLAEERERLERLRLDRERRVYAAQQEHARAFDAWQARRSAYDAQHTWYAVTLPPWVHRLDVVGGILPGWQALVATLGGTSLETGREVTVVDLTRGAVAADLVELAGYRNSRVWVLPEDLPLLDPEAGLGSVPARLRVLSLAPRRGGPGDSALGAYVSMVVAYESRAAPERESGLPVLVVCGAEKLRAEVLDLLYGVCVGTSSRLVAMYRSIPAYVWERRGGGESAIAFMRLGTVEDAELASEYLGPGTNLSIPQMSYPMQRTRDVPALPGEFSRLPVSAFVVSCDTPSGRWLVCGDANPAIASSREATYRTLEDVGRDAEPASAAEPPARSGVSTGSARDGDLADLPPNLGPPPERLDWRTHRRE